MLTRGFRLLGRMGLPAQIILTVICILVAAGGLMAYYSAEALRLGKEAVLAEKLAISDVVAAYEDNLFKKVKSEVAAFATSVDPGAPQLLWQDVPQLDRLLDVPGYDFNVWEAFHVSPEGKVTHSMATPASELNADPLFREIISRQPAGGPAIHGTSAVIEGMAVAFVSTPTRDSSGLLVIGIRVGSAVLSSFTFHSWMLGTSGYAEMVDSYGKVMIGTVPLDPSFMAKRPDDELRLADLLSTTKHQGYGEFPHLEMDGQDAAKQVIAMTRMIEAPWAVVVRQSADEAYAPVERSGRQLVGFAVATMLIPLGIVVSLSRRVVTRLGRLLKASNQMAAGNLDTQIPDLGQDEVGKLGAALEDMRRKLKEASAEAAARTREVEQTRANLDAEKLKAEFLSSVSHQLRTPLSSIKACATSLLSPGSRFDSATTMEFINEVDRRADELDSLITKLLQTARIEGHAIKLVKDPVLLPRTAQSVVAEVAARNPGLRFQCDFARGFPVVEGDQVYIEHVLRNYLENAAKYSPNRGLIVVSGEFCEKEKVVVVSVSDQGPGIPESAGKKLFERFYRLDGQRNSGPEGLGLGLYIVKALVEAHGGRVWHTSEPGKGSTFFFSLPYDPGASPPGEDYY